jgi:hypothetical protein
MQKKRPGFLFVGTGRAGSNWVFEILREHPEVFLPANKGTLFFNKFYKYGVEWYESFFDGMDGELISGEVCEEYLADEEAIKRIRAYREDMLLICCFRNPYERAISHWRFFERNGLEKPTISEQGRGRPDLFYLGYYATQLCQLRRLFSEKQVLVYLYDDLVDSPRRVARAIYEFIGVDADFIPPSLSHRVNVAHKPRLKPLARAVHNIHMRSWGGSRIVSNFVGRVKRIRPLRRLVKSVLYKSERAQDNWHDLVSEFPDEIQARFEDEIDRLEILLNRDLSHWRAKDGGAERSRGRPVADISNISTSGILRGASKNAV